MPPARPEPEPPASRRWWVDTNVVVRLVTGDPPVMAERATAFLEESTRAGRPLRLDPLVVAEALYVLTSFYGLPRGRAVEALRAVVDLPGLRVEQRAAVVRALELHRATPKLHFVDAWLTARAEAAGDGVVTFDAAMAKAAGVPALQPG